MKQLKINLLASVSKENVNLAPLLPHSTARKKVIGLDLDVCVHHVI